MQSNITLKLCYIHINDHNINHNSFTWRVVIGRKVTVDHLFTNYKLPCECIVTNIVAIYVFLAQLYFIGGKFHVIGGYCTELQGGSEGSVETFDFSTCK